MTQQNILKAIKKLRDDGLHFSYDQLPEQGKQGQNHAFEGWMHQIVDVGRLIKAKVGSGVLGMSNRAKMDYLSSQTALDKETFELIHGRLLEALNIAREQVSNLWPEESGVEVGDSQAKFERSTVLLSWSKMQSKTVALKLRDWLPKVIPGINPWMSSKDIEKGREWFGELQGILKKTQVCIICITPENVRSPWIYYEAGAITTNGPDVLICPYLVGVAPNMLADGPFGKWQCTIADRGDTWELAKSLNENTLDSKHDLDLLENNFQSHWPEFNEHLEFISQIEMEDSKDYISTEADRLAGINLPSEARTIVLELSKSVDGTLLYLQHRGNPPSVTFQVSGKNLCQDQSLRTIAKWERALDDLVAYGILNPIGHERKVFKITDKGYMVADVLLG